MTTPSYSGGCMCGAVRYLAGGAARYPCFCHCSSCRRSAGAPIVAWATFDRAAFRVTRGAVSEYRSSAKVTRGYCAACGSSLTFSNAARAHEIDVTLATLDEPAQLPPQMHLWVADKLPWITLTDDLPQYPAGVTPP